MAGAGTADVTRPVLVDVDPGNDDAVLLAMAAAAADLDVVGVTTVAGNAPIDLTTRNARAVLAWAGASDVPVARGAAAPLVRPPATADVHGPGGLYGDLPTPEGGPIDAPAARFLVERARERPGELSLLAVGPLTNVALALALEPDLPDLLDELYVMGGAATVSGNATPAAEFNFWADPEAARRVVRDAGPRVVGLDVTDRATAPAEAVRSWAGAGESGRTLAAWTAYSPPAAAAEAVVDDPPSVHDAVVGAHLLGDVLAFEACPAEVATGGPARGELIVDRRARSESEPNAEVALGVDVEAFRETLIEHLRGLATR